MGSSRQTRKRREREEKERQAKQKKVGNLFYTLGIIGVVIIILLSFVQFTGLMTRVLAAAKVGGTGYAVCNVNFFYRNAYNTFYSNNADNIASYLDQSKPLTSQPSIFDYNMTWAEYFWQEALSQLKQVTAVYNAALADGFSLHEEEQEEINGWFDSLKTAAEGSGYSFSNYLALYYGEGNNEKSVRAMLEKSVLADHYLAEKAESFSYSDDELEQYYDENRESYDSIAFISAWVSGASDESGLNGEDGTGGDSGADVASGEGNESGEGGADGVNAESGEHSHETPMEEALEIAQAISASASSRDNFRQQALALTGEPASSAVTPLKNLDPVYAGWLTDSARREGDTAYFEQDDGYRVLYYISSSDNHYNTVSVRHILVMVEDADADGMYSQEEMEAAHKEISEIYDSWQEAGGTEEAFIDLAMTRSEDAGSAEHGGLYENIYKNQMVESFDAFCFQKHEYGDTEIVFGSNDYYAGYHLIFFVGEGGPYWKTLAESAKRNADFSVWMEQLTSTYEVKETFLMRYAMDR